MDEREGCATDGCFLILLNVLVLLVVLAVKYGWF